MKAVTTFRVSEGKILVSVLLRDSKACQVWWTLTNRELRSCAAQPVGHQVKLFDFGELPAAFFAVHSLL